jgi:fimbrial isopeptide formation D2 family protein/uncharacterized repeat protein (TIGR01451 family)
MNVHETKSLFRISTALMVVSVVTMLSIMSTDGMAKSLYLIANINADPTPIHAYNIESDGSLTFQAEHYVPSYRGGAVGLALDSDSEYLFVTYEYSNVIQLLDARTMKDRGTTIAPGAENLAGIVYDHDKKLLYCVDRYQDFLYAYNWDAVTATLTPMPGSPFTLEGGSPLGIALDEINDLLYTANYVEEIRVYDTADWSLVRTIAVQRQAISVAVDPERGYLYYGGGYVENNHLGQYNLATDTETSIQVHDSKGVMGIDVDEDTGNIYFSTGKQMDPEDDEIMAYSPGLWDIDCVDVQGDPTGLVIPMKDLGYNPLSLTKTIAGNTVDPNETDPTQYVGVGENLTYNLCFQNNDSNDPIINIFIADALANEVEFVTADGDGDIGDYNPSTHTYTWFIPSLAPAASACLDLVVKVKQGTPPGTSIMNIATIESEETPPSTASATAVVKAYTYQALNLNKSVVGDPMDADPNAPPSYVNIGETFTYAVCFDNNDNIQAVSNVSIVDTLPDEVTFVTADGDGDIGHYDPNEHTYTWSIPTLLAGESNCLELTVQVNQDTEPNTTISNSVTISGDETPQTTASVDVITAEFAPLTADLRFLPRIIKRRYSQHIVAIVTLPYGIASSDLKEQPLMLFPGGIPTYSQRTLGGQTSRLKIVAFFSVDDIVQHVSPWGVVELTVAGELKDGRTFSPADDVVFTRTRCPFPVR